MNTSNNRRSDLDFLKGVSIIAVILYHVGVLPYGFLGVECFLVISGFLIIPNLSKQIAAKDFHYLQWLWKKLSRIWPITVCASAVCLVIGYRCLIPDTYENICQSIVASDLFANNILSAITTKNYWDTANELKPLMQMWYLGIMAQFFVLFPILITIIEKVIKKNQSNSLKEWLPVVLIGVISFLLYILPGEAFTQKFYFIQYRLWEFAFGGIIGIISTKRTLKIHPSVGVVSLICVILLFVLDFKSLEEIDNITIIGASSLMPDITNTKMLTTIVVSILSSLFIINRLSINYRWGGVCALGRMSLSLFVWHQLILAFLRLTVLDHFTWISFTGYLAGTWVISYISFRIIEPIKLKSLKSKIVFFTILILITASAFVVYRHGGVVRDVPELGISMENPLTNRNTEYTDQIYDFDKPFITDKIHVLVVGNSFARDFACILLEYDTGHNFEISYSYDGKADSERVRQSDYIFAFGPKDKLPNEILESVAKSTEIYGISTKSYGKDFNRFYFKRDDPDYLSQTIPSNTLCDSINAEWERSWGKNHFINLMEAIRLPDGKIPLFTDNGRVISFDCRHLTQDGCKFYAHKIDFDKIFNTSK